MDTIGDRIRAIRHHFNITQKVFGETIGVSDAHISKIEAGKDSPSKSLIKVISVKYKVNEEWLTEGKGKMLNDNINKSILGQTFKQLMDSNDLTMEEFVRESGINSSEYWLLERGNPNVTIDTLISVSEYFQISIDWLLTGYEYIRTDDGFERIVNITTKQRELLDMFRLLDEDDQESVLSLTKRLLKQ